MCTDYTNVHIFNYDKKTYTSKLLNRFCTTQIKMKILDQIIKKVVTCNLFLI
jgi:hypothetical protein